MFGKKQSPRNHYEYNGTTLVHMLTKATVYSFIRFDHTIFGATAQAYASFHLVYISKAG